MGPCLAMFCLSCPHVQNTGIQGNHGIIVIIVIITMITTIVIITLNASMAIFPSLEDPRSQPSTPGGGPGSAIFMFLLFLSFYFFEFSHGASCILQFSARVSLLNPYVKPSCGRPSPSRRCSAEISCPRRIRDLSRAPPGGGGAAT